MALHLWRMRGTFSSFSDAVCFLGLATGLATAFTKVEIWLCPLELFRVPNPNANRSSLKKFHNVEPRTMRSFGRSTRSLYRLPTGPGAALGTQPCPFRPIIMALGWVKSSGGEECCSLVASG